MPITEYDMILYIYILDVDQTYTDVVHIVLYIIYPRPWPTSVEVGPVRLASFHRSGLGRLGRQ